jgi:uncharacterized membrane protein YdjX (TVP38/TMEM64 family)
MGRLSDRRSFLYLFALGLGALCFGLAVYYSWTREAALFAYLKAHVREIQAFTSAYPWSSWLGFTFFYLVYVGLFLPVTAVLSLTGGAAFGFWSGLAAVSLARALGATMAFLLSRTLLRGWAQRRYGEFAAKIDAAVQRDGVYYLFFLRLAPLAPYNLTNLAMGLTGMPLPTYFLVTLIGMLPRTALWVNAGCQLSTLESLRDATSPRVLLSLLAIGIFPLLVKLLSRRFGAKQ